MKVLKIDIKQTLLDLPESQPIYYEAEYDPAQIMTRTQGEIPDQVTVRQHAYQIQDVFKRSIDGNTKERYAVRLDDRGVFEDLMAVSNQVLERMKLSSREDGYWDGEHEGFTKGENVCVKQSSICLGIRDFLRNSSV